MRRTRGGVALRGRCLQYGSGITFWPLIEMVAEAAGIGREDAPEVARGKIAALVDDRAVIDRVAAAVGLSEAPFPLDELYWGVRKLLRGDRRRPARSSRCSRTSTGPSLRCSRC